MLITAKPLHTCIACVLLNSGRCVDITRTRMQPCRCQRLPHTAWCDSPHSELIQRALRTRKHKKKNTYECVRELFIKCEQNNGNYPIDLRSWAIVNVSEHPIFSEQITSCLSIYKHVLIFESLRLFPMWKSSDIVRWYWSILWIIAGHMFPTSATFTLAWTFITFTSTS